MQLPFPLYSPSIMLQEQVVDECASVTLDASDTTGTGGWATFTWELEKDEVESINTGADPPYEKIEKLAQILAAKSGRDQSQVIIRIFKKKGIIQVSLII